MLDAIRGAYDLGFNDARNARSTPGDSAPGYKGREVETGHGGALIHALEAIAYLAARQTAAAAPRAEPQPVTLNEAMHAEAEALSAKASADFERMKRNDERYQWLRSRLPESAYLIAGVIYSEGGAGVDAAIDAAMGIGTAP